MVILPLESEADYWRRWYQVHLDRFERELGTAEARRVSGPDFPKTEAFFEFITGLAMSEASDNYEELVEEMDGDFQRFGKVAMWWEDRKPVLVDPVLVARCESLYNYMAQDEEDENHFEYQVHQQALKTVAEHIGHAMRTEISAILRRNVLIGFRGTKGDPTSGRGDMQSCWVVPEPNAPFLKVWINNEGMLICLSPGLGPHRGEGGEKRWYEELSKATPQRWDDVQFFNVGGGLYGEDRGLRGRAGSFVFGKWYEKHHLEGLNLRDEIESVVPRLRPILDKWLELHHWLSEPQKPRPSEPRVNPEAIATLAKKLLVDPEDLDTIVGLLDDKRQVVLYGPPGTGKTYLAKKLAETLAEDSDRRSLVQFHPSMSYEDFFEGYRPRVKDGRMVYELTPGPLRRLAEKAHSAPEQLHVMVIDEINRADLSTVLGELLFLLEYRNEDILTQYRPDEAFKLPKNLWFIGTMNTADRSIALVDTALRRRFHFVPFFPNHGPMKGLLERWLEKNDEEAWVGEIVARVNDELEEVLGGNHLQLGASHFMEEEISSDPTLRRVWEYTIMPFIEEQFFDRPDQIRRFRLDEVRSRYGPQDASDDENPEAD